MPTATTATAYGTSAIGAGRLSKYDILSQQQKSERERTEERENRDKATARARDQFFSPPSLPLSHDKPLQLDVASLMTFKKGWARRSAGQRKERRREEQKRASCRDHLIPLNLQRLSLSSLLPLPSFFLLFDFRLSPCAGRALYNCCACSPIKAPGCISVRQSAQETRRAHKVQGFGFASRPLSLFLSTLDLVNPFSESDSAAQIVLWLYSSYAWSGVLRKSRKQKERHCGAKCALRKGKSPRCLARKAAICVGCIGAIGACAALHRSRRSLKARDRRGGACLAVMPFFGYLSSDLRLCT